MQAPSQQAFCFFINSQSWKCSGAIIDFCPQPTGSFRRIRTSDGVLCNGGSYLEPQIKTMTGLRLISEPSPTRPTGKELGCGYVLSFRKTEIFTSANACTELADPQRVPHTHHSTASSRSFSGPTTTFRNIAWDSDMTDSPPNLKASQCVKHTTRQLYHLER